jgi:hypothetical protein
MRRKIPLLITFVIGVVLILGYFVTRGPLHTLYESFSDYFAIITVFAFILGGGSLMKVHLRRVANRSTDWSYSLVTIAGFLITLIVGLFKMGNPDGWSGAVLAPASWLQFIFNGIYNPLAATMFSLLAFFVASASYRAFRARTREATILLIAASIILLGRTPVGGWLTGWLPESLGFLDLPSLANWIMAWPNTAGQRAIMIGIALGVIATSLRIIFGIERTYLGREE